MLEESVEVVEAAFISDLHLHPDNFLITARFEAFIAWAATHIRHLYILGDFFHVWPGDDGMNAWSEGIAQRLKWLSGHGVRIYFMHGNRDFLLGKTFISAAGINLLKEPARIILDKTPVLLVHGDRYCTNDRKHQWFRKITRSRFFAPLFLQIPMYFRSKMVAGVRQLSQGGSYNVETMNVVTSVMVNHMRQHGVNTVIHGHTHKPGLSIHQENFKQYVLSDWDDRPQILLYDKSTGFYFNQM